MLHASLGFALFLSLTAAVPSAGGARARESESAEALRDFLQAVDAREAVVRRCRTSYFAGSFEGSAESPSLYIAGHLSLADGLETWCKWLVFPTQVPAASVHTQVIDGLRLADDAVSPTVWVSDGARTLVLEPDRKIDKLWNGVLFAEFDNRIRSGPLNCGVFFSERWLSAHLAPLTLVGSEPSGAGRTFEFALAPAKSRTSRYVVVAEADGLLRRISWHKGDKLAVHVEVLGSVVVEGLRMISEAEVIYEYTPRVRLHVRVQYDGLSVEGEPTSLLELPRLIVERGGAARVTDEVSQSVTQMGAPDVLELASRLGKSAAPTTRR